MKKILLALFLTVLFGVLNTVFAAEKVNVYYFYGKPRCVTCTKIETYTKSTVESMNDKNIIFKSIDMDKPENKKMINKYGLFTKSVVISKNKAGKEQWKNLDKIWLKARNEKVFKAYIVEEINNFKGK